MKLDALSCEVLQVNIAKLKNGIVGVPKSPALATVAAHLQLEFEAVVLCIVFNVNY